MDQNANRRVLTEAEVNARFRAALAEEEKHRDATLAQAREAFALIKLTRDAMAELKAAREARGISIAEVATRTGISTDEISRIENGEGLIPEFSTLVRLATAIGVKLDISVK